MTNSMTAFARSQAQIGSTLLCWELKSVNHRYLEPSFRLPDTFRFLEPALRQALRGKMSRGKLECQFKIDELNNQDQSLEVNPKLVDAILSLGHQLATQTELANDLKLSHLLSWPGVIKLKDVQQDQLNEAALSLFCEGLNKLVEMRQDEGMVLNEFICSRLDLLRQEISKVKQLTEGLSFQIRDKLLARLESLNVGASEQRVEQEIALLLTRLDVSEELDRLDAHCFEVERTLQRKEPIGRRLDFLMQELNREANTLSSKSDSSALTQAAVEMKVLIEQMREQIQNIE